MSKRYSRLTQRVCRCHANQKQIQEVINGIRSGKENTTRHQLVYYSYIITGNNYLHYNSGYDIKNVSCMP
jgi:hypothetical protein